ncbi:hypothetical protein Ccrd_006663, partial [Cynara cardunculus var. scolymus]
MKFSSLQVRPESQKVQMASGGQDLILALKETIRYGIFLGTFAGTFVSVDELIAGCFGRHLPLSNNKMEGFISRGSSWTFNVPHWIQHTTYKLGIWQFIFLCVQLPWHHNKRFGCICKPLTWAHGDLFLMCLSSTQILYLSVMCFVHPILLTSVTNRLIQFFSWTCP